MRHYPSKQLEKGHLDTFDVHPHSGEHVREQIERSRARLALSAEILSQPVPKFRHPKDPAMLTAAECRAFAGAFKSKAAKPGLPIRTATIMKNISRSFAGLASQLELLTDTIDPQEINAGLGGL
jgi:hypothetical protein